MGPVINNKSDDTQEKKGVMNNSVVLGAESPETIGDASDTLGGDEFRKTHLGDFNVKLSHILAYLKDGVPFGKDVDKNDLFASMIEYNTKIRSAIGKSDDYYDKENDKKAA